jgi:hypothetical protein
VRFIGLAEALGGLGVLVALVVGQNWLAILAASGLALVMLLVALFHATRREYREIGITLMLGAVPASVGPRPGVSNPLHVARHES